MKYKNIFSALGLTLVMGLVLIACSTDEISMERQRPVRMENGMYVYPVDLECPTPDYQDGNATRAVSYDWKNGATLFVRLKSGSSFVLGYVQFDAYGGHLYTFSDLPDTNNETECHLAYLEDSNGDYLSLNLNTQCFDIYNNGRLVKSTTIPLASDTIFISEQTGIYRTTEGKYTSSNKYFTIKATLTPRTWRMRFSGENGTTITLRRNDNDVSYLQWWKWSTTEDFRIGGNARTIRLTVNNGYTPYIYGFFENGVVNKITIENGNKTYTRNFDASYINASSSGVFTIPTASTYSSLGWAQQNTVLFEEPYVKWGATYATVKSEMAARGYQVMQEADDGSYILFKPKHQEDYTFYSFESGQLRTVYVDFGDNVTIEEMNNYLTSLDGVTFKYMSSDHTYYYSNPKTSSTIYLDEYKGTVILGYLRSVDLSVSPASLSFTANGGTKTINITSSSSWTASSDQSWLTVSPAAGSNDAEVTVKAEANTSTSPRTAKITVTDGETSQVIDVTQAGENVSLSVSKSSLSFTEAGGSESVTITSNTSWTVTSSQSWLTVSPTYGTGTKSVTIKADANTNTSSRTATVTVIYDSFTRTINVTQAGKPATQELVLKEMLQRPFGTVYGAAFTVYTYTEVKNKVKETYTIDEDNDGFWIWGTENASLSNMTYQGIPCHALSIDKYSSKNAVSSVYYIFEIDKSKFSTPYTTIRKMVDDFKAMGITMTIETNTGSYTLSKYSGSISIANYYVEASEYSASYQFIVSMYYK